LFVHLSFKELFMPRNNYLRRFWFLFVLTVCALALGGCSKSGGNTLHVKSPQTGDQELAIKSAFTFPVTKSFTDINNKITTAVTYNVYAANYELDSANFGMGLNKPLTADDQVRVMLNLVGDEGTKEDAPLKAGTYSAKAEKYMKVETVGTVTRKGGTETKNWLDRSSLTGEVKITSVSGDTASGEIDVTAGDSSIKGSFSAKILKRK
jgi:hypothetical protein